MDKQNRQALAYLLIGVSAAGRALLAVPENTQLQELSLTVLAVVGYFLVSRRGVVPLLCGIAQLVLELVLCGSQSGGLWVWLMPALRAVDLWLLLITVVLMLRQAGQTTKAMPVAAAVPLAVYTVTHFFPGAMAAASISFVIFSVILLWYAVLMLRAYNAVRVRH